MQILAAWRFMKLPCLCRVAMRPEAVLEAAQTKQEDWKDMKDFRPLENVSPGKATPVIFQDDSGKRRVQVSLEPAPSVLQAAACSRWIRLASPTRPPSEHALGACAFLDSIS